LHRHLIFLCMVTGTGDKKYPTERTVFHDLTPMRSRFPHVRFREAHAISVGTLLNRPFNGSLDICSGNHASPPTHGGDTKLRYSVFGGSAADDMGTTSAVQVFFIADISFEWKCVEVTGIATEIIAVGIID